MTASFPNSVKDFTDKEDGKKIYAAHINELQDEVEAIETTLLAGTEGQVLTAGSGGASWETPSGGGVTDVTYADLVTLIGASGLTVGQQYRITDYATTHYIVDGDGTQYTTGDGVIVGATEPLIVLATDVNKLDTVAKSASFPQDIIYYDWNPANWLNDLSFATTGTTIIAGWKGVIISRYDTVKELKAPGDWRNCLTRRWETNASAWSSAITYAAGEIISHAGTSMVYKSMVSSNLNNVPAGESDSYWLVLLDLSSFTYWNASPSSWYSVPSAVTYDDFMLFNDLSGCGNMSIETAIPLYIYGDENYVPASILPRSTFISVDNFNNKIGNSFHDNTIGYGFNNNTIGNEFQYNEVGIYTCNTVDFTSATHVYGAYNCYIFMRLDGTTKLRYFDNSDVQQVVAVTA